MHQEFLYQRAAERLAQFVNTGQQSILKGGKIGLEKESLRLGTDGVIAQTPHPRALGSTLTHPYITTDYSEALLELITPPAADAGEILRFLESIHRFVYANLDDELIWAASMPCVVSGEQSIPIARYGSSNIGMMKHIYRRGLGYRYGKVMQVIAGIHFNYSLPEPFWPAYQALERDKSRLQDFSNRHYFALIRNVHRFGWLVLYLFGASPAICKSFLGAQPTALQEYDHGTYFEPFATSLRMSDIGYSNKKREQINISYDNLEAYVAGLEKATATAFPPYEQIGVIVDGEYRQLNANILQIANEYYSAIRPKQPLQGNEKPTLALRRRGVQYVEFRVLDVDPFKPLGIDGPQLRFLEAFLLYCLLCDSPPIDAAEQKTIDHNQLAVASRGRDPALRLKSGDQQPGLRDWALQLCEGIAGVCELLDQGEAQRPYAQALAAQQTKIEDPDCTPAGQVLAEMRETSEGFFYFAERRSEQYRDYFREKPLSAEQQRFFQEQASASLQRQREIEAGDDLPFAQYLEQYFAQQ